MASTRTQQQEHPRQLKHLLSELPEIETKSGNVGASINLTNAIVGSGIIGIPFAVSESGFVVGMLLLIFVSVLAVKSLQMIVETASYHPNLPVKIQTYEDLMFMPYGEKGKMFILANKLLFAYGSMVAYLLIIKDTVPMMLGSPNDGLTREMTMLVTSFVIILPLSSMRDMASLASTSLLSVGADVVLLIFMCIYAPVSESVNSAGGFLEVLKDYAFNTHFFIGLGIISQAMTCQPLALIVNGSLESKTSANWGKVSSYSLSTAWLLCSIVGLVGMLAYLDDTQANILNNFETGSIAANGSRGLVAISMIFTYPMQCFVARHVLAKVLFNGDSEGEIEMSDDGVQIARGKYLGCIGRRVMITLGIYVATLVPALIFNDLGPVLSITGSIGGSCLAYIGPGLIYLGAHGDAFMEYTNGMLRKSSSGVDPSIELPAAGNASATMDSEQSATGSPPLWWYPLLVPLWRKVAATGGAGLKLRLQQLEEQNPGSTTTRTGEIVTPKHSWFFLSMFMVVFGIVALVAGVLSNVYVNLY